MIAGVREIVDLFFPAECIGCGAAVPNSFHDVCPVCRDLVKPAENACPVCSGKMADGSCAICSDRMIYMTGTIALSEYTGMMKTLITAMKFQKKPRIAGYLAELAVSQIRNAGASFDLITSVPMNKKKQWVRGFNQSELAARNMGKILKLPYKKVLAEMPHSGLQKTLSLKERFINIIGRYKVIDDTVAGKSILLIDDVFTTGATVNECSRLLIEAGCLRVHALVFARVNLNSDSISY